MQITAQVIGGEPKVLSGDEAATVGSVKAALGCQGYTAKVNGKTAQDGDSLADFAFVSLAEQVKGN